jgi:hypothetical protein
MGPLAIIGGMASIFGMGISMVGASEASDAAKSEANISKNIAGLQIQENQQRQLAMEMAGRREKIENARNTQIAHAKALAGAVSQGAQFGSGAAGAQGQIQSQGNFNEAGINSNLEIGRAMFGLDSQIDTQKMFMADAQSKQADAQGLMSLGQGISGAGGSMMKMFGG